MENPSLPNYERPPVVEVILGVQFEPLPDLTNAHLGAFWTTLGSDWVSVSDAPTLEPTFERFGSATASWRPLEVQFRLMKAPMTRLQIKNQAGDRMIQVQNGRLHFNWLRKANADYPRYATVRTDFYAALDQFKDFIATKNLGEFRPNQWEVTYINHVPRNTIWNTPTDWTFFRPFGELPVNEPFVNLETFGGEWHFVIPPKQGRLHIRWRHGEQREQAQNEVVVLTFTARGAVQDDDKECVNLPQGLDLGHEAIICTFRALMSDVANRFWGLSDEND